VASTDEEELLRTLDELAAFGEKRAGSEAGRRAAEHLADRFRAAGLADVRFEEFHFPSHQVVEAELAISVGGRPLAIGFDVLEGCGAGAVESAIVDGDGGTARDRLRGAIALLSRNPLYHRSTQADELARAGARALLLVSTAPDNLRQVGSVRAGWEAMAGIPALAIGAVDGATLRSALVAGRDVRARVRVDARVVDGRGQNVLGRVAGAEPHQVVVGAHYDTWFTGSTDNGGGVVALLALAARRARRPRPRYGLTFVAFDGEELALYGGYDFLRRHVVVGREPILALIDLETPSARDAQLYGLARSNHRPLDDAFADARDLFGACVPMDLVPEIMGGVVPTDVQGLYRSGTPSAATAVDSAWYHTVEDTPDKVDLGRLARIVDALDGALDRLLAAPPDHFAAPDPMLWRAEVALLPREAGGPLRFAIAISDAAGSPRTGAPVAATLLYDGFFPGATALAHTDGAGRAVVAVAVRMGGAPTFLHVAAGPRWPLVEKLFSLAE